MKKTKSCCFIQGTFSNFTEKEGEKGIFEQLKKKIKEQIDLLIEKENICEFYTGMEEGADLFYANYILSKKKESNILLNCVIAFEEQAANYSEENRDLYFSVAEGSDKEIMISRKRTLGCREKRDSLMIKNSDIVILLHDMNQPVNSLNLQKIDDNKQIIIIDPFNSKQNASFKCVV